MLGSTADVLFVQIFRRQNIRWKTRVPAKKKKKKKFASTEIFGDFCNFAFLDSLHPGTASTVEKTERSWSILRDFQRSRKHGEKLYFCIVCAKVRTQELGKSVWSWSEIFIIYKKNSMGVV